MQPSRSPQPAPDIDCLFVGWLLDAGLPADIDPGDNELRLLRALERSAEADDRELAQLVPRVPDVVPLLLQSLRDSRVSTSDLSAQIAQDPVLVAEVLRQANASRFGRTQPITGIGQALALLGQNGLRQLVARVAFKPVIGSQSGPCTRLAAPRLWEHSERCATVCRDLGAERLIDPFAAFLAGLLHQVGMVAALRILDQSQRAAVLPSTPFCAALLLHARQFAWRIGRAWELPPAALGAIADQAMHASSATMAVPGQVLHAGARLVAIRTLAEHGAIDEEQALTAAADAAIDGLRRYRELAAATDPR